MLKQILSISFGLIAITAALSSQLALAVTCNSPHSGHHPSTDTAHCTCNTGYQGPNGGPPCSSIAAATGCTPPATLASNGACYPPTEAYACVSPATYDDAKGQCDTRTLAAAVTVYKCAGSSAEVAQSTVCSTAHVTNPPPCPNSSYFNFVLASKNCVRNY